MHFSDASQTPQILLTIKVEVTAKQKENSFLFIPNIGQKEIPL